MEIITCVGRGIFVELRGSEAIKLVMLDVPNGPTQTSLFNFVTYFRAFCFTSIVLLSSSCDVVILSFCHYLQLKLVHFNIKDIFGMKL